jgi:hypothetical protein
MCLEQLDVFFRVLFSLPRRLLFHLMLSVVITRGVNAIMRMRQALAQCPSGCIGCQWRSHWPRCGYSHCVETLPASVNHRQHSTVHSKGRSQLFRILRRVARLRALHLTECGWIADAKRPLGAMTRSENGLTRTDDLGEAPRRKRYDFAGRSSQKAGLQGRSLADAEKAYDRTADQGYASWCSTKC